MRLFAEFNFCNFASSNGPLQNPMKIQTLTTILTVSLASAGLAQTVESLRTRSVPEPSQLSQFIRDKPAAIALGKALFWDTQIGSDSRTSCASCHFHAGADSRVKNQVNPGILANPADSTFQLAGPNGVLKRENFPFHKLSDVNNRRSTVLSDVNDIASSQGVFSEDFRGLDANRQEIRARAADPIFNKGGVNTRRVEPRNTPTVINAVFNQRNFWDGRAMDTFNGVSPFGRRDTSARVWKSTFGWDLSSTTVTLDNASLASQAVGPALSAFEMSAAGKTFQDLGRRVLVQRPLALQRIHPEDSVFAGKIHSSGQGLSAANYSELIKAAFQPAWWQSTAKVASSGLASSTWWSNSMGFWSTLFGTTTKASTATNYSQMEANFSLFFGLSVQMYEATLVSAQTPFDSYAEGVSTALTEQQKQGLSIFNSKGKCFSCHGGAEFTNASVQKTRNERMTRMIMGDGQRAVYDEGFYNIGVRPTANDIGLGGNDPFGTPLSLARIASQKGSLAYWNAVGVYPNTLVLWGERVAADGAFKVPGLRNVELTAPYFHNGGQRTLREVVDFYNRGGDFADQNRANLDADIQPLGLTDAEKDALVAFLKSLTDERVRYHKAPFDHPQLIVPNGHVGDGVVTNDGSGKATEEFLEVPATGRNGAAPLRNFLE